MTRMTGFELSVREFEDAIINRRLQELACSAAYADDTVTEKAIRRVAEAGGWDAPRPA